VAEIDKLPDSAMEVEEQAQIITIDYAQVRGWFEESQKTIGVVHVGERTVVKPPWEEYEPKPGEVVLEIDPGAAFGSGLHESTALCVEELERRVRPGMSEIDFGTGSGVLAICAAKLGASRVTAVEADVESVEIARNNVRLNKLGSVVDVVYADTPAAARNRANLVVANVVPAALIAHSRSLFDALEPGGVLIASGMATKQADEVEKAFIEAGFSILDRPTKPRWAALVASR